MNKDIRLLQTADPVVYMPFLNVTARANRAYCTRWGLDYESFVGLKRGVYPWHAIFNRIPLLDEAYESGFRGWMIYLDADAYVLDQAFDVKAYLADKGRLFMIAAPGAANGKWDINDGVLLINFAHENAGRMIKQWARLFEQQVSDADLVSSMKPWSLGVDDQSILHAVLRNNEFESSYLIEPHSFINSNHASFIRQIIRVLGSLEERINIATKEIAAALGPDHVGMSDAGETHPSI